MLLSSPEEKEIYVVQDACEYDADGSEDVEHLKAFVVDRSRAVNEGCRSDDDEDWRQAPDEDREKSFCFLRDGVNYLDNVADREEKGESSEEQEAYDLE